MSAFVSVLGSSWVVLVLLLSARLAALFLMTPFLYALPVPAVVRVLLVLALSAALALPFAATGDIPAITDAGALVQALLREFALGATLGLGILMAFAGFALAGRLLDVQIGFGIGQVFDPLTRTQVPVLTSVFSLFGILLLFLVNGHHALLRGVAYSIERFPVGRDWPLQQSAGPVLQQATGLFTLGFALAAPVVLCLLLLEFALGVVARNLPQINMFVLAIPIKVIAGLLVLSLWAGGMGTVTIRIYAEIHRTWTSLFEMPQAGGRR
jgi:flagellar biosynthesis protein FliR